MLCKLEMSLLFIVSYTTFFLGITGILGWSNRGGAFAMHVGPGILDGITGILVIPCHPMWSKLMPI